MTEFEKEVLKKLDEIRDAQKAAPIALPIYIPVPQPYPVYPPPAPHPWQIQPAPWGGPVITYCGNNTTAPHLTNPCIPNTTSAHFV